MTPERYLQLLDAYGADTRRWPDDERAAAEALAQTLPAALQAAQHEAAALDALLAAHAVASPAPALAARIAQLGRTAPTPPSRPWWRRRTWPAWAAVSLAGAATGVLVATLLLHAGPQPGDPWSDTADVFGARRTEWSEE